MSRQFLDGGRLALLPGGFPGVDEGGGPFEDAFGAQAMRRIPGDGGTALRAVLRGFGHNTRFLSRFVGQVTGSDDFFNGREGHVSRVRGGMEP